MKTAKHEQSATQKKCNLKIKIEKSATRGNCIIEKAKHEKSET